MKTFLDEIPKVPKSAFSDLKDAELSDLESTDSGSGSERGTFPVHPPTTLATSSGRYPHLTNSQNMPSTTKSTPSFSPLFAQPSGCPDFFNRLRDQKVRLESAYMSSVSTIKGIVRVVNLDFHKSVTIKYTSNDWASSSETQASYLPGSCDGFSDKFVFILDISDIVGQIGKKVQFCLCFSCGQNQYWDNNSGKNYIFQCFGGPQVQKSVPVPANHQFRSQSQQNQVKPLGHFGMGASPSTNDDPWQRYL